MNQYFPILKRTQLFAGVGEESLSAMLSCLGARSCSYQKGEYVLRQGAHLSDILVLVEGELHIQKDDYWGNRSILGHIAAGEMFGEAYAAVPNEPLMVDVVAVEDTVVLFLNLAKMQTTCTHACPHHARISASVTAIIARKSLDLSRRILHVAPKTIRGKVLAYLSDIAERTGENEFDIPFDRQQLADYLGVDRSALSAELSRMQKAGLIETRRSHFVLK